MLEGGEDAGNSTVNDDTVRSVHAIRYPVASGVDGGRCWQSVSQILSADALPA